MLSKAQGSTTERARVRRELLDLIEQIEQAAGRALPRVSTGWDRADAALEGGLRRGALHEWFGPEGLRGAWTPALLILIHLARRAIADAAGVPQGWTVWIGKKVWPAIHAIPHVRSRALFIDAASGGDRLWAIDAALRCPGLVVIADGSGLDAPGTRRVQLAAEAGGSLGLIARPGREIRSISAAATRWRVDPAVSRGEGPRWRVELVRCKGPRGGAAEVAVDVERDGSGSVVALPARMVGRPGTARLAS